MEDVARYKFDCLIFYSILKDLFHHVGLLLCIEFVLSIFDLVLYTWFQRNLSSQTAQVRIEISMFRLLCTVNYVFEHKLPDLVSSEISNFKNAFKTLNRPKTVFSNNSEVGA